ncbi:hypothetical protein HS327_01261 [Glaesserella parasuis]|nr:hypothetical protein HS327_01261 [Glaesserella parasuis]
MPFSCGSTEIGAASCCAFLAAPPFPPPDVAKPIRPKPPAMPAPIFHQAGNASVNKNASFDKICATTVSFPNFAISNSGRANSET